MEKKIKTAKQLERHFKGMANHRRIDILKLIAENEGISLGDITEGLNCNFKTVSEHTRRLAQAGLVNKKYQGRTVAHSLSPYGKIFYKFIKTFSHSWECENVKFEELGSKKLKLWAKHTTFIAMKAAI